MTILEYMAQQRDKIRARHSGEEFFFQNGREMNSPVKLEEYRSASVILEEIDQLKGLNMVGRGMFTRKDKISNKNGFAV